MQIDIYEYKNVSKCGRVILFRLGFIRCAHVSIFTAKCTGSATVNNSKRLGLSLCPAPEHHHLSTFIILPSQHLLINSTHTEEVIANTAKQPMFFQKNTSSSFLS